MRVLFSDDLVQNISGRLFAAVLFIVLLFALLFVLLIHGSPSGMIMVP